MLNALFDKQKLIVQKFGGSSVATPEQIIEVARRIKRTRDAGNSLVVVVSAMGKTTDDLVSLARQVSPVPNRRELDMLLSTGERISMSLLAMALTDLGVPAISLTGSQAGLMTDASHSNAHILSVKPIRVEEELKKGSVVVLAGFQGVNPDLKEITTLGRGGSDTTAVAMAAHFKASICEILKDVDGVFSADPKIVKEARHLPELNYEQLLEMTFWGAKVLHYRSVELADRCGVTLRIALTHGRGRETIVKKDANMFEQQKVLAINSHKNVYGLNVFSAQQAKALDEFNKFLQKHRLPWPQILNCDSTHDSTQIYFVSSGETAEALKTLANSESTMQLSSAAYSTVTLTCVGSVATSLPAEICQLLQSKNINVHKTHLSSTSLTLYVEQRQSETAVQLLHSKYFR